MTRRLGRLAAIPCLVLLSAACDVKVGEGGLSMDFGGGKASDEWVRTYSLGPGGRLEVEAVNGQIHVSPSTNAMVEVRATREARAGSEEAAREILRKAEMREEVAADRVSVRVPEDQGEGGFGRARLVVRYEVRVPPGLTVRFKVQNGDVRLEDIKGQMTASSINGAVNGRGLSGAIDASTVNGGMQIEIESLTADARLTAVNGGIRLMLAPGVNAELEASALNGGVSVDDDLRLSGDERGRGRITGRLNKGGPRLAVQVTNGGVRIEPRREPGA